MYAVQPAPASWVVAATAVVAVVLVLAPGAWPLSRHVVTIAHEGGHGLVAACTGRRLTGIRLHSDTSGLTVSRGRPSGLGLVQIRNWFGLWSVLLTGAVVFAVSWWLPTRGQSAFAYLVTCFLLVAAPRP